MVVRDFTLHFNTDGFCHVVDVTEQVQERIRESGLLSGIVTVFVIGATAGVTTLEYEPGLIKDVEELFNELAPLNKSYHHEKTWHDGNGFSHVRASLLKPSLTIPFANGRMRLGTWQQIVVVDFDNRPRNRDVAVQIMGE